MGHDRKHGKLGVLLGPLGVRDDRDAPGTDDEGHELGAGTQGDGLLRPFCRLVRSRDHQQATRTLEASPEARDVDGPTEALSGGRRELDLDDDADDGVAVVEEHQKVGAMNVQSWCAPRSCAGCRSEPRISPGLCCARSRTTSYTSALSANPST